MKPKITKPLLSKLLEERFANDNVTSLAKLPHPHTLKNSALAAKRIKTAVENDQKIVVVGDYDVDGVSSSALLHQFFDHIGYEVQIIIPNRFTDGYGLGEKLVEKISCDLLITVDNGIAAHAAAKLCADRGIELIIVDHHTIPQEMPQAFAVVHPKQEGCDFPFKDVCAATLTWYLVGALKLEFGLNLDMKNLLDIVAIATIADVMPLVDINRTIVRCGLEVMGTTSRPAIEALRIKLGKEEFDSSDVAFAISPRLNCAGRLQSAQLAFRFLCAKTLLEAQRLLEELNCLNDERKLIEKEVYEQACMQINDGDRVAVVSGDGWHEGVVGIVASRLCANFKIPSIVLSLHGDRAKGSARSVGDVNIYELIAEHKHLLSAFGGHKMAAGLSLSTERVEEFAQKMRKSATKIPHDLFTATQNDVLGELAMEHIDMELCSILQKFEPYGEANARPRFLAKGKFVKKRDYIGKDAQTLRLWIEESGTTLKAICFRPTHAVAEGSRIDFCYTVVKNSFNNQTSVELLIEDIKMGSS